MKRFLQNFAAIFTLCSGILAVTSSPALANANTSVVCGYMAQDTTTGLKVGVFYRNDLTATLSGSTISNDQWQRAGCDGGYGRDSGTDWTKNYITKKYGNMNGWYRQRYETTWADRCNDSDPVAMYFGTKRNKCANYVKGTINYAKAGEATPHDLLSCMANDHYYEVSYDGQQLKFTDLTNNKILTISDSQLNCLPGTPFNDPPVNLKP